MKNGVTSLFNPSGEPLFAVEVGKGAYELTSKRPSVGKVSPKTKQKNRARNKVARKSRQCNR